MLINKTDKYKFIVKKTILPQIYSLIKLHKENYPVVSYTMSTASRISKFLNGINRDCSQLKAKFSIENS